MQILVIFLVYFLWMISLLGYGSIFKYITEFTTEKRAVYIPKELIITISGIFGIIFVSQMGLLLNFVIPISSLVTLIIQSFGIVLFLINFKYLWGTLSSSDTLVVIFLFFYFSIFPHKLCILNFDVLNYHIDSIKWCQESTVPFGLANLHGRLGFNSTWFVLGSILDPSLLFSGSKTFIVNSILSFYFSVAVLLTIKNELFLKRDIATYFISLCIIPLVFKLENNSTSSPDNAIVLLNLFAIFLFISRTKGKNLYRSYILLAILISIYLVTIKISSGVLIVASCLFLVYVFYIKSGKILTSRLFGFEKNGYRTFYTSVVFLIVILIPWFVKGIILSGCLIYPSKIGYFSNLPWAVDPDQLQTELKVTMAYARLEGVDCMTTLSNWNWFLPWLKLLIKDDLFLITLLIVGIAVNFIQVKKNSKLFRIEVLISLSVCILGLVYWFFTVPSIRFGYGYLYSMAFLLAASGFQNIQSNFRVNFNFFESKFFSRNSLGIMGIISLIIGLVFLFPIFQSFFVLTIESIKHRPIDQNYWRTSFSSFGLAFLVSGISLLIFIGFKAGKVVAITMVFLIFLTVHEFGRSLIEISTPCKLERLIDVSKFSCKAYQTFEGKIIYSTVNKFTDNSAYQVTDSSRLAFCDVPLLYSPYFYPSLKIKMNKGKPFMFISSSEFSKMEKYSFMFGVYPPLKKQ